MFGKFKKVFVIAAIFNIKLMLNHSLYFALLAMASFTFIT